MKTKISNDRITMVIYLQRILRYFHIQRSRHISLSILLIHLLYKFGPKILFKTVEIPSDPQMRRYLTDLFLVIKPHTFSSGISRSYIISIMIVNITSIFKTYYRIANISIIIINNIRVHSAWINQSCAQLDRLINRKQNKKQFPWRSWKNPQ